MGSLRCSIIDVVVTIVTEETDRSGHKGPAGNALSPEFEGLAGCLLDRWSASPWVPGRAGKAADLLGDGGRATLGRRVWPSVVTGASRLPRSYDR